MKEISGSLISTFVVVVDSVDVVVVVVDSVDVVVVVVDSVDVVVVVVDSVDVAVSIGSTDSGISSDEMLQLTKNNNKKINDLYIKLIL